MGVGLEVWNAAGVPQTIDLSYNLTFAEKGTVNIGTNTSATGAFGFVSLPTKPEPYLIFAKTNSSNNVCILAMKDNGFDYHLPQGSTTFEWWAYSRGNNTGYNVGMQVFNADGSLRWNIGQRPLIFTSVFNPVGSAPYSGELSTANVIVNPDTNTIPNGHAVMFSDPGQFLDLYTGFPGPSVQPNMRYWPCINTNGTALKINYGRQYANRPSLPSGVSYQTFVAKQPNWVFTAEAF